MKMNLKFYKNTNEVVLVGIVSAILFVFGFFFETVFKGEALGTVIGISPIEGLLIVPLVILGLFPTLVTAAIYVTLLFVFKGTSTNGIGEVALTLALCSWIFGYVFMNILTRPLKGREPIRGIVTLILAALFTTAVMSVINYVLITPSYFNGLSWTFVWDLVRDKEWATYQSVWDYVWMPTYTTLFNSSKAGAGIIHGNLIKYGLAALLAIALLGNKKSWAFFERNSKKNKLK